MNQHSLGWVCARRPNLVGARLRQCPHLRVPGRPGLGQSGGLASSEVISTSSCRRFPVTVSHLPVMRCQICHRTGAYRPGKASEVLAGHCRRAHPEALGLPPRSRAPEIPVPSAGAAAGVGRLGTILPSAVCRGLGPWAPAVTERGQSAVAARARSRLRHYYELRSDRGSAPNWNFCAQALRSAARVSAANIRQGGRRSGKLVALRDDCWPRPTHDIRLIGLFT